ncbi:hypothetical protein BGZ83_011465 [Gryganskiella cystojenkinii]|nr:hypothetical protein BGZ83_011465 [Gryganskiella cystojenkinii]
MKNIFSVALLATLAFAITVVAQETPSIDTEAPSIDTEAPSIDAETPSTTNEDGALWNKKHHHHRKHHKHGKHHKKKKCCIKYVTVTLTTTCKPEPTRSPPKSWEDGDFAPHNIEPAVPTPGYF